MKTYSTPLSRIASPGHHAGDRRGTRAVSRWLVPFAGVATLLSACSSNPTAEQVTARSPAHSENPKTALATPAMPGPASAPAIDPRPSATNTAPAKRSVYFDYDSSLVNDGLKVVATNAGWLASNRKTRVVIEGNTDERGSREYNLALGQRRADAVKERMTLLGVPAQQIETVSFGEEKPRVDAQTEQAFAENRRADILYSSR